MDLTGICLNDPDLSAHIAAMKGFPIYVVDNRDNHRFRDEGINVEGSLSDVLSEVEVIVDSTPAGSGKKNKDAFYSKHKAIFQAGEPFDIADIPVFTSNTGYETARKARYVRIPTPYTVALGRTLGPLNAGFRIKEIFGSFIVAGSEPMRAHLGPVDTILPDKIDILRLMKDEIQYLMPNPITLSSIRVPSILLSVESIIVRFHEKVTLSDVKDLLCKTWRTILVRAEAGLHSTDSIFEFMRRIVRPSGDAYEVCIWDEQIEIADEKLKLVQALDPHCVQTPEVIDAIRALASNVNVEKSMNRTDEALGILSPGTYP
jgi:glyceraldehyde-3-phosphate dehydrogenase (NAD(P))